MSIEINLTIDINHQARGLPLQIYYILENKIISQIIRDIEKPLMIEFLLDLN